MSTGFSRAHGKISIQATEAIDGFEACHARGGHFASHADRGQRLTRVLLEYDVFACLDSKALPALVLSSHGRGMKENSFVATRREVEQPEVATSYHDDERNPATGSKKC